MRLSSFPMIVSTAAVLLLSGCASDHHSGHHHYKSASLDPFAGTGSPYYRGKGPIPFGGGRYQVGDAYQVAGRTFTPHEQPGYDKTGTASWYGEAFHRRRTSNGEWFDMNTLTAAHATLPLPSYALVTNLENNREVIVRINDRGPFVSTRVIDLSKHAADLLAYRNKGTAHVRVRLIGVAPLDDHGEHVMAMNQALHNGASFKQLASLANTPDARGSVQVAQLQTEVQPEPQPEPMIQQASVEAPAAQAVPAGYLIRVGVFHDFNNANQAYQSLASFGPAEIIKAVGASGPLYRVQMGPFDNQEDATAALETAVSSGYEDARTIEAPVTRVSMN